MFSPNRLELRNALTFDKYASIDPKNSSPECFTEALSAYESHFGGSMFRKRGVEAASILVRVPRF